MEATVVQEAPTLQSVISHAERLAQRASELQDASSVVAAALSGGTQNPLEKNADHPTPPPASMIEAMHRNLCKLERALERTRDEVRSAGRALGLHRTEVESPMAGGTTGGRVAYGMPAR